MFLVLVRKIRLQLLESQAFSPSSVLTAFVWGFSFMKGKGLAGSGESDGNAGKREKKISSQNLQWKITRDFFFLLFLSASFEPPCWRGLPWPQRAGGLIAGQCTSGDAVHSHPCLPAEPGLSAVAAASVNPDSRGVMLPRLLNWQHVRGMSPG